MYSLLKLGLFIFLAWTSPLAKGNESMRSKTLRIVAPYLPENVESDGKRGRDIEFFKAITNCMNVKVKIDVQPYMRHLKSYLSSDDYDGIMTIPSSVQGINHRTEDYISYNNGVIVRQKEFPKGVGKLDDLKGKHIISFIGSKALLKGISSKMDIFASYTETTTQYHHNEMLMKKRVDGVFSDGLIFMAHQKRLLEREPRWKNIKVKFYSLFSLSHFSAAFKKKELVSQFNSCFKGLKKTGELQKIERIYADKYDEILGKEYLIPLINKLKE